MIARLHDNGTEIRVDLGNTGKNWPNCDNTQIGFMWLEVGNPWLKARDYCRKHGVTEFVLSCRNVTLMPEDYDTASMILDLCHGNCQFPDDAEDYRHETIVQNSLVNGQFEQARNQCSEYGMDYELELSKHYSHT